MNARQTAKNEIETSIAKKTKRLLNLNTREKNVRIIRWIRFRDKKLRKKFPILERQNLWGASITVGSAGMMFLTASAYIAELIPAWVAIVTNAVFASFLHEIEHDTIHNLYFKDDPKKQNLIFWTVWILRGNTISPWYRRMIHILHHKVSGNKDDIEERLIGNGMNAGWSRLFAMIDGNVSAILNFRKLARDAPKFKRKEIVRESWPWLVLFYALWYNFLLWNVSYYANHWMGFPISLPFSETLETIRSFLNLIGVVYLLPNWIRQSSIQIVSSNMHYYGDVRGIHQQTQVWNAWFLAPLHLFCFNFGSTHGIHHFVVNQPFYLRQMVAPFVHPAMKRYGIRFNDFESMLRANRYDPEPT
ncbi:fatty acid desaturase [Leptospira gomenensis]|uniref:Fatty acid desaturase n=1 Tax=Leptospira gomenensis TaxID=2484974 RepID=A0A5F1YCM9_9LEPT|nr:fatty acid desaturase [Leptospira gomenensis]TGK33220.1 fatty acid desaturase [Leptospira gomenensis]TGK35548.1 fatty acid desaturase [Leptospira gomenensis]TGK40871.1 fatty acid desaturase [Leptospira gomenensis]TGK61162.1 fatty acid desaturase [Leptospira gomenensis]